MITLRQVSLRRGAKVLFQDTDLALFPGHKIGLTGANGTGKSSLFALLRGELHPDAGDVDTPASWVIAHVAQETPALDASALDYVLDGDREFRRLEAAIASAPADDPGIGELHEQFRAIDGYGAAARAARILSGLGFETAQLQHAVRTFSGGWRMRLNLAQALVCRSDLLLLDEPTNHLDLDAILWLEQWLTAYPGTMVLISHDRDFLDNTVQGICHIENQTITQFRGNYSAFESKRAEQLAQQQAAFAKQQRQIAHLQRFVDRFRAQATKATQAQSRLKALDRMQLIAAAHIDSPFEFHFPSPPTMPDVLLRVEQAGVGYGELNVLSDLRLVLRPGDRVGLLGRNGAGKSTLIRFIARELAVRGGECHWHPQCRIGYFAQHQLEQLSAADTPITHLTRQDRQTREQDLRNYLGGFGFAGSMADQPISTFSGGERARLVLATLVWARPNLLLLDEPTNHLDIEMREAIVTALQEYEGALVLVSHDRHLLRMTTDEFLLVAKGGVTPFAGDLEDYRTWLEAERRAAAEDAPRDITSTVDRKAQRRQEAQARDQLAQRRRPLQNKLKSLEARLSTLNSQRTNLEKILASPDIYDASRRADLQCALVDQASVTAALQEAEEQWLEAQMGLDALS